MGVWDQAPPIPSNSPPHTLISMLKPIIIVTNDDGIKSPGLLAAVGALRGLGEIIVAAPKAQQSSAGRAFYWRDRGPRRSRLRLGEQVFQAYAVDASPAVSVRYALQLVAKRTPSLVVSGINYGENLGNGLTISGTVGAALEAASEGVPALAVSLETKKEYHTSHSTTVDFRAAAHFTRLFAKRMLQSSLPLEARLLNVNVPSRATRKTPWRVTRASRQAYFHSLVNRGRFVGYDVQVDLSTLEPDSDVFASFVDHVISVTPLTGDLTARVELRVIEEILANAHG
jgi:5'/3'-nucleotidase